MNMDIFPVMLITKIGKYEVSSFSEIENIIVKDSETLTIIENGLKSINCELAKFGSEMWYDDRRWVFSIPDCVTRIEPGKDTDFYNLYDYPATVESINNLKENVIKYMVYYSAASRGKVINEINEKIKPYNATLHFFEKTPEYLYEYGAHEKYCLGLECSDGSWITWSNNIVHATPDGIRVKKNWIIDLATAKAGKVINGELDGLSYSDAMKKLQEMMENN